MEPSNPVFRAAHATPISRRAFGIGVVVAGVALSPGSARAGTVKTGPHLKVIELFTSEGCWSCPPAERKLREVADDPGILALAYHVDYWDYIGWVDPYADPQFTQRQRLYARYLRSRTVYTPQMVFQGAFHAPGSRPGEMNRELDRIDRLERITVGLDRAEDEVVEVSLPLHKGAPDSTVHLVTYDRERTTDVLRGENAGKTLTHRNVVRHLQHIGSWSGDIGRLRARTSAGPVKPGSGCAVLVQANDTGRILGAASFDLQV